VLVVDERIRVPLRELDFDFARSSGPGGQHVNRAATKAVLRWRVTESPSLPEDVRERFLERWKRRITKDGDLIVQSQRFRDQGRNVADCLEKLRSMLEAVARPPRRRKKTKPSRAAKRRRIENKRRRSETKRLRKPPRRPDE